MLSRAGPPWVNFAAPGALILYGEVCNSEKEVLAQNELDINTVCRTTRR
jgi:hypothetical protein